MVELITDIEDISSLLNVNVRKMFTMVSVGYDAYKVMAPKIVKVKNKTFLLACHLEKGNIMAQKEITKSLPSELEIIYYSPFFNFEGTDINVYPDFIDAFKKITEGEKEVIIQQNTPVSIYKLLMKNYNVKFKKEQINNSKYIMYVLSKDEVIKKFNFKRDKADKIAIKLIGKSPLKSCLEKLIFNRIDSRFETLDKLMQKDKMDAVFCTSPLGVQEITGYGLKKYQEDQLAALYNKGENNIYLFSKQPLGKEFENGKKVDIFSEISRKLTNGNVLGIEEEHFPASLLKDLEIFTGNIKNSMTLIRKSRQNRGWEDLSYYIIASRATVYAIDGALKWAGDKIMNEERISELDVENKYRVLLQNFTEKYNIPFSIVPMLTICYAGNRSIIPSLPTEYFLNSNNKSLKIDAGVSITDDYGIHHAASDITRTLILEKEIQQAYKKLENFMVKEVIPNIKPGMEGKDIYQLAVSKIEDDKDYFKNIGLLSLKVNKFDEIFNRNVGHLMGLQEPVTLFFVKNATEKVNTGMIAAIEYQWHTKNYGIGIEDNFVIGSVGGLNYSRDKL